MESKSLRSPSVACRPQRQAGQHRSPEVALRSTPLAVALPMALPGTADPQVWCPAEHSRRPREVPQGRGLSLPGGAPAGLMASTPPERPEAAPGRPAGVPAGHAVPGLGPGGRRGAQAAAGLDGRATQDEAGPASLRGTEQRSPPESPSGAVSGGARPRPSSSPPSICSSALRLGRPGQGWASGQPGVSSPESCSQCWAGAATQGPTGPSCAGRTAWSRS